MKDLIECRSARKVWETFCEEGNLGLQIKSVNLMAKQFDIIMFRNLWAIYDILFHEQPEDPWDFWGTVREIGCRNEAFRGNNDLEVWGHIVDLADYLTDKHLEQARLREGDLELDEGTRSLLTEFQKWIEMPPQEIVDMLNEIEFDE